MATSRPAPLAPVATVPVAALAEISWLGSRSSRKGAPWDISTPNRAMRLLHLQCTRPVGLHAPAPPRPFPRLPLALSPSPHPRPRRYAAYDGGASEGDEYSARDSDGGQPPHASPGNGVQSPGFVAPSPGYEMPPAGWGAESGESGDGFGMGLGVLPESDAGLRLQHAAKLLLEQAAAEARLAREQPWAAPLGHGAERPQAVADAVNHVLVYAREGVRRGGYGRRRRHLLAAAVRVLLSTAPAAAVRALQVEAALPLLLRLVAAHLWPLRAPPSVATAMATDDANAVLAQRMRPPPPAQPPRPSQPRVAAAVPTGGRAARRAPPPPRAPPHAHVPPPRAEEHQWAHAASPMMRRPRGAAAPAVGLPPRPAAGRSGRPELQLKELNLRPLKGMRDPSLLTSVANPPPP